MGLRKTPSLSYSEFVSVDVDNSTEVGRARLELIEVVKRVHPPFLKKLASEVFPVYAKHAENRNGFEKTLSLRGSPVRRLERGSQLESALSHWAAEFNVDCDWLLDDALRTLRGWRVAPDWRESLKWNPFHGKPRHHVNGDAFKFQCGGWEPQLLTWSDYSKYVRKLFEENLAVYEQATRKFAESQGLTRARHKYSPQNLEWFVLSQIAGMTSKQIADRYAGRVDDSAVIKGVKAAAALVGWDRSQRPKRNLNIR